MSDRRKFFAPGRTPGSRSCDVPGVAPEQPRIDDSAAESLLRGKRPVHLDGPETERILAFLGEVRALGSGPAPAPTGLLAALLEDGTAGVGVGAIDPAPAPRRRAGRTLPARVAAGVTVALLSVTGAAAADVLPQPIQDGVSDAYETVSPLDLPDSADNRADQAPDVEERVADARDGGVADRDRPDGGRDETVVTVVSTSPSARPARTPSPAPAQPSGRPSTPGQQGLDRANETPAQGSAPTVLPSPSRRPVQPGAAASTRPTPRPSPAGAATLRPAAEQAERPPRLPAPAGRRAAER